MKSMIWLTCSHRVLDTWTFSLDRTLGVWDTIQPHSVASVHKEATKQCLLFLKIFGMFKQLNNNCVFLAFTSHVMIWLACGHRVLDTWAFSLDRNLGVPAPIQRLSASVQEKLKSSVYFYLIFGIFKQLWRQSSWRNGNIHLFRFGELNGWPIKLSGQTTGLLFRGLRAVSSFFLTLKK